MAHQESLLVLLKRNFKTNGIKTIIGQSLGGLLATEILFKEPHLFDNYIIVSPSLWWDDQSLLEIEPKTYKTNKKIYVAVGKEGEIMERDAHRLYKKLNNKKEDNTSLHFGFFDNLDHGDTLHLAVYNAFDALFKK